jgi:predicted DNA-binding ribbon-helix-helix protein
MADHFPYLDTIIYMRQILIFLKKITKRTRYMSRENQVHWSAPSARKNGATVKSAIIKRSIALAGHKTSVSLENEFWDGMRQIADQKNTTVSALLQQIDTGRRYANLSSAIRIFVFNQFRAQANAAQRPSGPRVSTPSVVEFEPTL